MKNPLRKRLPRELVGDLSKYLVVFLFMTLTIGMISGFLVADDSMLQAYNESFEKYNIEDGTYLPQYDGGLPRLAYDVCRTEGIRRDVRTRTDRLLCRGVLPDGAHPQNPDG